MVSVKKNSEGKDIENGSYLKIIEATILLLQQSPFYILLSPVLSKN